MEKSMELADKMASEEELSDSTTTMMENLTASIYAEYKNMNEDEVWHEVHENCLRGWLP